MEFARTDELKNRKIQEPKNAGNSRAEKPKNISKGMRHNSKGSKVEDLEDQNC